MSLRSDIVGAFIDAVYAIAVTILALEIPSEFPEGAFSFMLFSEVVVEYGVAFLLLFTFWFQHRRINGLTETVKRFELLTNALVLMLACLIPRATKLVFEFGGDITLAELEGTLTTGTGWSLAESVDLLYVAVVILTDLSILLLLSLNARESVAEDLGKLKTSKRTVTTLVLVITGTSFLLPVENRFSLLVIPLVLFFKEDISNFYRHLATRR